MSRFLCIAVGALGYVVSLAGLVLFLLFAGGWRLGPFWIDNPPSSPIGVALGVDLFLVVVFGLQHTLMARPWFKSRWTRIIPTPIERSLYCITTTAAICLLCFFWQPLPGVVWSTDIPMLRVGLNTLQLFGWTLLVASSFMISHTELFGLRQVAASTTGQSDTDRVFTERSLYRYVRHPLQSGVLVALWATPHMSTSHMFFAAMLSTYVLIGLHHEERDLVTQFGEDYLDYRRRVPMLVPYRRARPHATHGSQSSPADSAA